MAERVRVAIVLGVGGAAVGGPEALRLMMAVAGGSAAVDVTICVFLVCTFTALVLGNLLLVRFLRDAGRRRNAGAAAPAPAPAPATERFAKMTAAVALVAMFFITASLLAVPSIPNGRGNAAGGAARSSSA